MKKRVKENKKKKAQSQIISTVLLILLVLAAIVIVSNVVFKVIKQGSKEVSTNMFTNEIDVKEATKSGGNLNVKVKRTKGTDIITELKILVYEKNGNVQTISKPLANNIEQLETNDITITSADGYVDDPTTSIEKVSVVPIFGNKAGIETTINTVGSVVQDIIMKPVKYYMNGDITLRVYRRIGSNLPDSLTFEIKEGNNIVKTVTKSKNTDYPSGITDNPSLSKDFTIYEGEIYPDNLNNPSREITEVTVTPDYVTSIGEETKSTAGVDKTPLALSNGIVRAGNLVPNPLFSKINPNPTMRDPDSTRWTSGLPTLSNSPVTIMESSNAYYYVSTETTGTGICYGWINNNDKIDIDPNKNYKFSIWVQTNDPGTDTAGSFSDPSIDSYIGILSLYKSDGTTKTYLGSDTPVSMYFKDGAQTEQSLNTWKKWEAYIKAADPVAMPKGGVCDVPSTSGRDWCNRPEAEFIQITFVSCYGDGLGSNKMYFLYPRIEEVSSVS